MTVTLHLKPEVEAGLLAHAQASGLTVEAFLLSVVEGGVFPATQKTAYRFTPPLPETVVSRDAQYDSPAALGNRAEAVRRMLEFGDKHRLSLGEPITRALLHEGHRF